MTGDDVVLVCIAALIGGMIGSAVGELFSNIEPRYSYTELLQMAEQAKLDRMLKRRKEMKRNE